MFCNSEQQAVNGIIQEFLEKGVIKESEHENGEVISQIFLRPKKNGKYRLILNLKQLNRHIENFHFKMDTFVSAIKLVHKNCFMASIDLLDAYYSVPMDKASTKFLKFQWQGKLYAFTCMPNGLCSAPRTFTKLMKPCFAWLRQLGHTNVAYIDDSLLISDSFTECQENVGDTKRVLEKLGFLINMQKSVLKPTQQITFLGFIIDSVTMTVTLTPQKQESTKNIIQNLILKRKATIREVAIVVGKIVACFPAVTHGPLHYRFLDIGKNNALRRFKGNFEAMMQIDQDMKTDLQWWLDNVDTASAEILPRKVDIELTSDASSLGWGATCEGTKTGGRWSVEEAEAHINCLELIAGFLALKAFRSRLHGKHALIHMDNATAISYLNEQGGSRSEACNRIAREVWLWCIDNDILITATFIPGRDNVSADRCSRQFNDNIEWSLNDAVFLDIVKNFGSFTIDLFATRLNHKVNRYISWQADPEALAIDAFLFNWKGEYFYAFPPFCLLPMCVQKIRQDEAEGVLIIPQWPTQPWFTCVMKLLIDVPRCLPRQKDLLSLPGTSQSHPQGKRLHLLACHVSSNPLKQGDFRKSQPTLSCRAGGNPLRNNTTLTLRSGESIVVENKLVRLRPL